MEEFDEIEVENKLHIIISVKDFRAILQHAQTTSGALAARYSSPGRPMKLQYEADAIVCEFILMTVGEKDTTVAQKMKNVRSKAPKAVGSGLEAGSHRGSSVALNETQQLPKEVPRPSAQHRSPIRPRQPLFDMRPPPLPPPGTARSEGLFVTQDEDDQQWEPANSGDEEENIDNARLEWDASNQPVQVITSVAPNRMLIFNSSNRRCESIATSTLRRNPGTRLQANFRQNWSLLSAYPKSASLASFRPSDLCRSSGICLLFDENVVGVRVGGRYQLLLP